MNLLKQNLWKFDKKLQVFPLFFCFFNTKFDFWWWLWQPFLLPTSRPLHDIPVGKSSTRLLASLFVYVGYDSRTLFYDHDNYLYELLIRIRIRLSHLLPLKLYQLFHLYLPSYLHSIYVYLYTHRTLFTLTTSGVRPGATLFRRSWITYIRILILIRTTYTSCCGPPG